jgi:hypothetical protein
MFVSFTLDPMLSSIWHDPAVHGPGPRRGWYAHTIGRVLEQFDRFVQWLSKIYQVTLRWSLRHRIATLVLAVATFVAGLLLPASGLVGTEFVPQADYSETGVIFYTPVGSSLEFTESKARQVEQALHALPEVRDLYTTINTGTAQGKNYATVYARLVPRSERKRSTKQLSQPLREQLARIPVGHRPSGRCSRQRRALGEWWGDDDGVRPLPKQPKLCTKGRRMRWRGRVRVPSHNCASILFLTLANQNRTIPPPKGETPRRSTAACTPSLRMVDRIMNPMFSLDIRTRRKMRYVPKKTTNINIAHELVTTPSTHAH